ncbi:hypothetical protein [Psychromarinibacter halotolerans]|uniref:Uncharacterized protein n=1 Tax=Psychromarinibacter halotolerans TaxID=1775175 RepID=A0ABV7GTF4_9RHOB|nr:hypothetical protein [Psychromarinibacter halotolerans]MDF0598269.1 hypothetical protein [Psychromarinibacter halotolerans]
MTAGIGHNGGPTMEAGYRWRKHVWTKARAELIPNTVPLEIVRRRVKRAAALGIDYRTYASIRAASGHDVVAFLFSGNALDLRSRRVAVPDGIGQRLHDLQGRADRLAAVYAMPEAVAGANPGLFELVSQAPSFTESWSATARRLTELLAAKGARRDEVVLVSATSVETEWCGAGRLAGVIPAERFFGTAG